jgi:hypothetical protein
MSSIVIFPAQSHPGDSVPATAIGDKYKGDGFYSRSDGLHTLQYKTTGFIGTISVEATLETAPTEDDWFGILLNSKDTENYTIDTTGKIEAGTAVYSKTYTDSTDAVEVFNFTGNYVWIRAKITNWTDGTVNVIRLNH